MFNFLKSLEWIELWNFKVIFIFQYHFYKLQHVLQNYHVIHKHLHRSNSKPTVNRQSGFRSGSSKGRSPSRSFSRNFENFKKKKSSFSTFLKSLEWIDLWNFKVIFKLWYHFYKLQYVLHNNYRDSQALSGSNDLQKLLFHGQEYRRAAAPSGPLSYCFGMATSGEPSTWLPLGKLEGQEPLPLTFSRKFEISRKSHHCSTFLKSLAPIELWNFKVISNIQYHFYKLQYVLQNYYWITNPMFSKKWSSKTTSSWSRVSACSRPFWPA